MQSDAGDKSRGQKQIASLGYTEENNLEQGNMKVHEVGCIVQKMCVGLLIYGRGLSSVGFIYIYI